MDARLVRGIDLVRDARAFTVNVGARAFLLSVPAYSMSTGVRSGASPARASEAASSILPTTRYCCRLLMLTRQVRNFSWMKKEADSEDHDR